MSRFSLRAIRATMKKIRFKLRKKEKEGKQDDVFEASLKARQLDEALKNTDSKTATTRLKEFFTNPVCRLPGKKFPISNGPSILLPSKWKSFRRT